MNRRLFFLYFIVVFTVAAVVVRLFTLQVLKHDFYKELAANQHFLSQVLAPSRGEVFIHRGATDDLVPLVANIDKDLVYAVPPEIEDKVQTAQILSKILDMPSDAVLERISNNSRKWVIIRREIPDSASLEIKELKLSGIYLQPEPLRFYPEGELAAHILGFFGYDGDRRVGRYGVEGYFENLLSGKVGSVSMVKDASGRWITGASRELNPAVDGSDLILTLDRAIQFKVENILRAAVETHQADSGGVVVMDPRTGAILAMANYPTFNPNHFNEVEDQSYYLNKTVSEAYEPGSVFKPFIMAAALDANVVTPDMTYEDMGEVKIDRFTIRNSDNKAHGVQTMTEVLEKSLNTGMMFVQNILGRELFLNYVQGFGFGSKTEIALPAESAGNIRNLIGGGEIYYATASFGQGITSTLLQLAQGYGAIANEGKMMRPYIVERVVHRDGREESIVPEMVSQVISSRTAHIVSAMMAIVVESGHGQRAGVEGYYVAGKTGTAQVASTSGPGYDRSRTNGTFAGFAPIDDPKFVIAVRIENPKGVRFAESTAAPVFGEIAQFLLNYYQISPMR